MAWSLIGVGAALVSAGALQSRAAWTVADQLSFMLSAGLGGTLAVTAGATLLVSAGLHDEWRRLHQRQATAQPATHGALERGGRYRERPYLLGWALFGAAALVLIGGSRGSATAASDPEQIAFLISGGFGALLLAVLGATLVLSTDLRSVAAELGAAQTLRRGAWLAVGVLGLGGAAVVVFGWARAAGTDRMQTALDGLAIAAAGLAAVTLTLGTAGVRLRHTLVRGLASLPSAPTAVSRIEHQALANGSANGFYTVQGLGRFHRPSCPALSSTGGERQPVPRTGTRLEPCLLCVEET